MIVGWYPPVSSNMASWEIFEVAMEINGFTIAMEVMAPVAP